MPTQNLVSVGYGEFIVVPQMVVLDLDEESFNPQTNQSFEHLSFAYIEVEAGRVGISAVPATWPEAPPEFTMELKAGQKLSWTIGADIPPGVKIVLTNMDWLAASNANATSSVPVESAEVQFVMMGKYPTLPGA